MERNDYAMACAVTKHAWELSSGAARLKRTSGGTMIAALPRSFAWWSPCS